MHVSNVSFWGSPLGFGVMDSMVENLKIRFLKHKQLYQDFACFDPRRFPELRKQGVPVDALEKISEIPETG